MSKLVKTIQEQKLTLGAILLSSLLTGSGIKVFGNVDQDAENKLQSQITDLRIQVATINGKLDILLERKSK